MKQRLSSAKYKHSTLNFQLSTVLLMVVLFASPLKAQVKIGDVVNPQSYSIVEIDTTQYKGGLRMPQLTTFQRDSIGGILKQATNQVAGKGLVIFNTDTKCLEFWNGSTWISLCSDILGSNTIQLTSAANTEIACSGSVITPITVTVANTITLTSDAGTDAQTIAVENAITDITYSTTGATGATFDGLPSGITGSWSNNAVTITGTPVAVGVFNYTVTLTGGCGASATGTITVSPALTTFTDVMYDFQTQQLEAYPSTGITSYRWQVSQTSNENDFVDISGAPDSNFYTIPAQFATNQPGANASAKTDSLFFRCILTAASGDVVTNGLNMLFIRTNTPGYGTDGNGVRYLTIQKGLNGVNTPATTGSIKIALLNLGASEGNDAGDWGDLYQWGRVKDGHEHVIWSKDAGHVNTIAPFNNGTTPDTISKDLLGTVTYTNYPTVSTDKNWGQIPAASSGYGEFIKSSEDWGAGSPVAQSRWGDGTNNRPASEITWTHPSNNPCPSGWRIPSIWNWWNIYGGTGNDTSLNSSSVSTVNNWYWRATSNNAVGGAIITNASGEKVFLPALGYRFYTDGTLVSTSGIIVAVCHLRRTASMPITCLLASLA